MYGAQIYVPTEETFPKVADVVVSGAGIVGVATAFWYDIGLHQHGYLFVRANPAMVGELLGLAWHTIAQSQSAKGGDFTQAQSGSTARGAFRRTPWSEASCVRRVDI